MSYLYMIIKHMYKKRGFSKKNDLVLWVLRSGIGIIKYFEYNIFYFQFVLI